MKSANENENSQSKFALWHLEVGSRVFYRGQPHKIVHLLNMRQILAENLHTHKSEILLITELSPFESVAPDGEQLGSVADGIELETVSSEDWAEARRRFSYVQKMLIPSCTRAQVDAMASKAGISASTLYRLKNQYLLVGKISALLPRLHPGGKGKSRLDSRVDAVTTATIEEIYLVPERPSIKETWLEVKRRCHRAGLPPPCENTVKNRIDAIDNRRKILAREGRNAARRKEPTRGKFPELLAPLEVVQIDHTPVDVMIVNAVTRIALGRPYVTVLIDVESRVVLGFYVTFDEPGLLSVGQCLVHAMLPKNDWLRESDIDFSWDVWGIVKRIHADNAGEFRSGDLQRACQEYGIDIEWRPVGKPNYGGHIESLLDTFKDKIQELPGTTFSNVQARGDYDSEGRAVLTLDEFEKWLAIYIIGQYHQTIHSQLGVSPITKFEQGIFGYEGKPGIGIPEIILNKEKLWLDFLPAFERTVQDYGVSIDEIRYDDSILNRFRGERDPNDKKHARTFIFKRDPRNISKIYFYHSEIKQYFPIPYRNLSNPSMSLWELKAVRRRLKEQNINRIESEEIIFRALEEMRGVIDNATTTTKRARREFERNRRLAISQGSIPGPTPARNINPVVAAPEKHSSVSAASKTVTSSIVPDEISDSNALPQSNKRFDVYKVKRIKH